MNMVGFLVIAAAMAAPPAWPQEGSDPLRELREVSAAVSGRALPAEAAGMLAIADGASVAVHAPTGQVLVWTSGSGIVDWGEPVLMTQGDLVSVAFRSGRRVVVSPRALAAAIVSAEAGESVPGADCLDRIGIMGGTLTSPAGPLGSGWRIEPSRRGRLIADPDGGRGSWRAMGDRIEVQVGADVRVLPCSELEAALASDPVPGTDAALQLAALVGILEDGNWALDRLAEYQRHLTALAEASDAEALAARRTVADCRKLPTLLSSATAWLPHTGRTDGRPEKDGSREFG